MENEKIKELNKAVRTIKENCGNFNSPCEGCYFKKDGRCSLQNQPPIWWEGVKEPYKITELEKQLLIHFKNQGYIYIARDKGGSLFIYKELPKKQAYFWGGVKNLNNCLDVVVFKNVFQFVQWEDEEPTKIDDVLNNYVIVDEE